jgi:hypothetical protein
LHLRQFLRLRPNPALPPKTNVKADPAVMAHDETRGAVKVVMRVVRAEVVDQRAVAVVVAEVLVRTAPLRVSVSDWMLKTDRFQVKPARTWQQHQRAQQDKTQPGQNRGLQNVHHATQGANAATVANPGLTLALNVDQTGTGAPRRLPVPICL